MSQPDVGQGYVLGSLAMGQDGGLGLMPARWWADKTLALRLEGGHKNGTCQCPYGKQAPKSGCYQYLCPWGESQLLSASPGHSLRSASESDPGSFQITASALELEHVRSCANC